MTYESTADQESNLAAAEHRAAQRAYLHQAEAQQIIIDNRTAGITRAAQRDTVIALLELLQERMGLVYGEMIDALPESRAMDAQVGRIERRAIDDDKAIERVIWLLKVHPEIFPAA